MEPRSFPRSLEAEMALLGGLLMDPNALDTISQMIKPEQFYAPHHKELYELLLSMRQDNEPIDMVTVPERVSQLDRADAYGGLTYVLQLTDHVPSTANLPHYASLIRDKAVLRKLIEVASSAVDEAYRNPEQPRSLVDKALRDVMTLTEEGAGRTWKPVSVVVDEELDRIEELEKKSSDVTGLDTGFAELNAKLAGLQPSDLIILAARPAMGKTALVLNLALNAAMHNDVGVGLYSLEMGAGQLVDRLLCNLGLVHAGNLRRGKLDESEWARLTSASDQLRKLQIHIDDSAGVTIGDVTSRARRLKASNPNLGLIVIDYLQLMQGSDPRAPRQQQISEISRGLKILAMELGIPVIALSQLNRGVEQRQEKRPLVSDLRESGAIEQDADIIMFIYRDEVYNPETPERGVAEVIIAKQRNGPTGTVKLVFQGQYARFDDYAPDDAPLDLV